MEVTTSTPASSMGAALAATGPGGVKPRTAAFALDFDAEQDTSSS